MANDKILKLNTVSSKLLKDECKKAFREANYVTAFSIYNGLNIESKRVLLPEVASFYASVFDACGEFGCLMKMIAYPKSHNLDPQIIMNRIKRFVVPLAGVDFISYYRKLIRRTFGVEIDEKDDFDRIIADGAVQAKREDKKLRLLDDEEEGKFYYDQAVLSLNNSSRAEALSLLNLVKPEDKMFIEAQQMYAILAQFDGDIQGATEKCMAILEVEPDNIEALKRLTAIAKDHIEYATKINRFLTTVKFSDSNDDANFALAKIYIENNDFKKAEEALSKIKSIFVYSENYLLMQTRVYEELGKIDECIESLKTLITIFPKNVRSRYKLRCMQQAKEKGVKYSNEFEMKRMREEIDSFLDETTEEDFKKLNITELIYYFRCICYYSSDITLKKASLVMLTVPKLRETIFDSLIEIETSEKQKEIILSTIIQLAQADELFIVIYGKLKKISISYPTILYNKSYMQSLKSLNTVKSSVDNYRAYVINAYAQAYTVRLFDEGDMRNFASNAEIVVNGLIRLKAEQKMLFDNLDNLVFAFCVADDDIYAVSKVMFASIKPETKKEIVELVEQFRQIKE